MRKRKLFPRVSSFFREPGRSASSEDALLLIDIIQEAFHDLEAGDLIDGAWRFMEGTVENAMLRYRAGELPLQAVEVAAAFTPIGRPKNYGVRPLWELALDLGDFLGRYPAHSRTSEEVAAANRIAPLGAGGNARVIIQELRPELYHQRHRGIFYEALLCMMDGISGTSHVALEKLRAIADKNPQSPALLWLDEAASVVSGDEARQTVRRNAVDAHMQSGEFGGKNCGRLASVVGLGRKSFEQASVYQDLWLRISAAALRDAQERADKEAEFDRELEELHAKVMALLPNAPQEPQRRKFHRRSWLDDVIEQGEAEIRMEEEEYGPFLMTPKVDPQEMLRLDGCTHYALLGFRQLYGLELLRDALPKLGEALSSQGHLGEVN